MVAKSHILVVLSNNFQLEKITLSEAARRADMTESEFKLKAGLNS